MQTNGAADRAAHGVQPGSGLSWREAAAGVVSNLSLFGLDIAAPLSLTWFNDASRNSGVRGLPCADGQQPFALLVGNSKAIWAPFIAACTSHNELLQEANPLDSYVERSVEAVCSDALPGINLRVYWGHQRTADAPDGGYVSLQRAAAVAGLAYQDPVSHLCLHPKYGAWLSLRCLLVFDGIQYTGPKPAPLRNPHTLTTTQYVRMAVNSAMRGSSCDLDRLAKQAKSGGETPSPEAVRQQWHKWVAVRDAHCAGHPWRYSKHQLAYHYTQDKRILRRLVAAASCPRFAPQRLAVELELPEATLRREARRGSFDGQPCTPSPVAADRRRLASSKSMGAGGIPIPWRTSNGGAGGSPVSAFAAAAAKVEDDHFAAALNADLLRVASAPVGAPVQKRLQDEARCEAMLARVDSMSGDEGSDASEQSDSTATPFDDHHARRSSARAESLQKPLDLLVLQH